MSETTKVVRGIIRPDGSLELAEPLSWPPGEVFEVTFRSLSTENSERAGFESRTSPPPGTMEANRKSGENTLDPVSRAAEGYGPYLARIRARREAEGFPFQSKSEIDAEMEALRSWPDRSEEPTPNNTGENGESNHSC